MESRLTEQREDGLTRERPAFEGKVFHFGLDHPYSLP
jgi:hypothetical protein